MERTTTVAVSLVKRPPLVGAIRTVNDNLQQQALAIFQQDLLLSGDLPAGWSTGSLLDIANYLNGLAMQKFRPTDGENGLPVLKIKELRRDSAIPAVNFALQASSRSTSYTMAM